MLLLLGFFFSIVFISQYVDPRLVHWKSICTEISSHYAKNMCIKDNWLYLQSVPIVMQYTHYIMGRNFGTNWPPVGKPSIGVLVTDQKHEAYIPCCDLSNL